MPTNFYASLMSTAGIAGLPLSVGISREKLGNSSSDIEQVVSSNAPPPLNQAPGEYCFQAVQGYHSNINLRIIHTILIPINLPNHYIIAEIRLDKKTLRIGDSGPSDTHKSSVSTNLLR